MVIGLSITMFLGGVWEDDTVNAWRVTTTLQVWKDLNLPATAVWHK